MFKQLLNLVNLHFLTEILSGRFCYIWQVIMADKDFTERKTFSAAFPDACIQICLYHTLRTFRRQLTVDRYGITSTLRSSLLSIMQQMAYAMTADHYNKLYEDFTAVAPLPVKAYFDSCWNGITDEWVKGFMSAQSTFLNSTNNRLESINQKVKSVCRPNSTLLDFLTNFRKVLCSLRFERDHRAISIFQKVSVLPFDEGSDLGLYNQYLTPFSLEKVATQYNNHASYIGTQQHDDSFFFVSNSGDHTATSTTCSCSFSMSMRLPCRHIFSVRHQLLVPLFEESLCARRWTRTFYKLSHRIFRSQHFASGTVSTFLATPSRNVPDRNARYRRALQVNCIYILRKKIIYRNFDAAYLFIL